MARFTLPRDIYYGRGALEALRSLHGERAMLILGGGSMRRFGFADKAQAHLEAAGMTVRLYENVEPDPSVETVLDGAKAMREFKPDWIVAMGGGSPIDAAKAMWVFYEYPETDFTSLIAPFHFPKLRRFAHFAAIPSTSGTATEVTAFSVITDYALGIKYPLADYEITPDLAIVDPDLAQSMPPKLAAYTGMDALTHAIEAYVSTMSSCFTDPMALKAIEMVFSYLPDSYRGSEQAREKMHYAQCLAGIAFTNALLGVVHAIAHKTGAVFDTGHIPHGCANAMYLPYVIRYNAKTEASRYGEIAAMLHLPGKDDAAKTESLIKRIREYNELFGIPDSLAAFGVGQQEFESKLTAIAHAAVLDACTASNPRAIDEQQMQRLLRCIYSGAEVDF